MIKRQMDDPGNISFLKMKNDLPFKVPSGYFDSLPERLDERIRSLKENVPVRRTLPLRPYLAAAVIIIVALIGGSLILRDNRNNVDLNVQISQTIDRELHSIPESVIIEVMSAPSAEEPGVETDEIIDYLINENIQYEDLLNEF